MQYEKEMGRKEPGKRRWDQTLKAQKGYLWVLAQYFVDDGLRKDGYWRVIYHTDINDNNVIITVAFSLMVVEHLFCLGLRCSS